MSPSHEIALKVLDGNQRANPVATMLLLDQLKLLTESESKKLEKYEKTHLGSKHEVFKILKMWVCTNKNNNTQN